MVPRLFSLRRPQLKALKLSRALGTVSIVVQLP